MDRAGARDGELVRVVVAREEEQRIEELPRADSLAGAEPLADERHPRDRPRDGHRALPRHLAQRESRGHDLRQRRDLPPLVRSLGPEDATGVCVHEDGGRRADRDAVALEERRPVDETRRRLPRWGGVRDRALRRCLRGRRGAAAWRCARPRASEPDACGGGGEHDEREERDPAGAVAAPPAPSRYRRQNVQRHDPMLTPVSACLQHPLLEWRRCGPRPSCGRDSRRSSRRRATCGCPRRP